MKITEININEQNKSASLEGNIRRIPVPLLFPWFLLGRDMVSVVVGYIHTIFVNAAVLATKPTGMFSSRFSTKERWALGRFASFLGHEHPSSIEITAL
jgi:hypothetical protein